MLKGYENKTRHKNCTAENRTWPPKPAIFITWPFTGKVCWLLIIVIKEQPQWLFFSLCWVPDPFQSTCRVLSHLILTTILWDGYDYPHFTEEEIGPEKLSSLSKVTQPVVAKLVFWNWTVDPVQIPNSSTALRFSSQVGGQPPPPVASCNFAVLFKVNV